MATQFFASEFVQELLQRLEKSLQLITSSAKTSALREAVRVIKANGKKFDEGAAANVDWIGKSIAAEVDALEKEEPPQEAIDEVYATFYRFVSEFDLTLPATSDLGFELRKFLSYAREHATEFSESAQRTFRYADISMPVQVMKSLLGSELLINIRNIATYSGDIEKRLSGWDSSLREREKAVSTLHDALKEYETGFNFVGLHKGFDDLAKDKRTELSSLRRTMIGIGVVALFPMALELWYLLLSLDRFDQVKWALAAGTLPALSFTVLLIYYFRLSVRAVDGVKSQLLQLELRKTLCRFIQSYMEYAKKAKEGGAESLGRFESIVFSGIVSTDEKMPATFDGIEQIANLVKSLKSS